MSQKTTTLSIRIPTEMRLDLEALAEKNELSLSDFVKRTLRENMTGQRFAHARDELARLDASAQDISGQTAQIARTHRELLEKTQEHGNSMLSVIAAVRQQLDELERIVAGMQKREQNTRYTALFIAAVFMFAFGLVGACLGHWMLH